MKKQRKAQHSDDELDRIRREAVEFAGIGLYKFKFDGTVLFMDRGARHIFELEDQFPEPAAIAGKDLADLVVYTGPKGMMRREIRKRKRMRGREWSFRTLKGNEKRVLEDSYLSSDPQTGEEAVQVVIRDVTEQKRADDALRASERRFRETLENAQLVAVQLDISGAIAFCNDFLLELTGWKREEILGREWLDLFIPEELREEMRQIFRNEAGFREDMPSHYENYILTRTGERRLVSWSNTILRDEANTPIGVTSIGEDITYRKQAEEALGWSAHVSDRLRSLVLTLNSCTTLDEMLAPLLDTAIDVCRMDGGGVYLVEEAEAVLQHHRGLPEAFVRAVRRVPLSPPVPQAVLNTEGPVNVMALSPGSILPYEAHGLRHVYSVGLRAGGETFGFLNLASFREAPPTPADIQSLGVLALETQSLFNRLRVESALRESEEKYREILEEIQEGYYEVDLEGNFTFFNDALCRSLGYAREEMLGLNYRAYYAGGGATTDVYRTYSQVYRTGVPIQVFDWQVLRKDGSNITVEVSISLMRDTAGQPTGFRGIVRDVTQRKQAEKALREAEERYRELFENANDIVYTHDLEGRITSLNKAGERITGYSRDEAFALPSVLDVVAQEYRAKAAEMIEKKIVGEDPTQYELDIVSKDGRRIPVEVSTRLILGDGKPVGVQGIARDITERVHAEDERERLEAQIRHTQKLEGLGVLAGGIAHDFNNLLVGVLGYAGLALTKLDAESPARAYVENIETSAQRAAELTSQMLAYSGKAVFSVRPLSLSKLAQEMGNLLGAAVSKKAVLKYHCDPSLPLIHGDSSQLHQVIMNLIINASEAIGDDQGVITLSTSTFQADREYLATTFLDDELPAGHYACLAVSDTGCGMDEETQSRIFDPFFSTKFTGRGLGLAAVLGIVRGHKGAIKVYSEEGQGTTVRVLLPVIESEAAQDGLRTVVEGTQDLVGWQGAGTILVADDQEASRAVAKEALEEHGFRVLMAADGREALNAFSDHADEISAVLLDLTMPVMGGDEAFEEIQKIRSEVPIILSSGYAEQDVTSRFVGKRPAAFLQKPYLVPALVRKIHDVLES